jgi:hypothetical protein
MARPTTKHLTVRDEILERGWEIVLEEPENVREIAPDLFQRTPARYAAETVASIAGRNPQTYRKDASSLDLLLELILDFEEKREALGGHGPTIEQR